MLGRNSTAAVIVVALSLSGCLSAKARYVSKGADSGEIAIPADTLKNREKARELMAAHFPDGYETVYEYEKVVGKTVKENEHTHNYGPQAQTAGYFQQDAQGKKNYGVGYFGGFPAARNSVTTTSTFDRAEWRIVYRRKKDRSPREGGTSIGHLPGADDLNGPKRNVTSGGETADESVTPVNAER